jgi:hypothetical protein
MFHSPTKLPASGSQLYPIFDKQQQQQQQDQDQQQQQQHQQPQRPHKRPRGVEKANGTNSDSEDDTMDELRFTQLLNAITANNEAIRSSNTAQLAKIDELRENVTTQVNSVKDELTKVANKVDKHEGAINILRRQMNDMDQTKFETHMEIAGIVKAEIEKNRADIATFAKNIITGYYKNLSNDSIREAFVRDTPKADFSVIVVIFASADMKNAVMKKKRETKDGTKIYFDDRVTSTTRALFMKAKETAKAIGAKKASLNHGKVSIIKQDDSRLKIRWFDDLERLLQATRPQVSVISTNAVVIRSNDRIAIKACLQLQESIKSLPKVFAIRFHNLSVHPYVYFQSQTTENPYNHKHLSHFNQRCSQRHTNGIKQFHDPSTQRPRPQR